MKTQLLCTFAHRKDLDLISDYITKSYTVAERRIFVFADADNKNDLYLTSNDFSSFADIIYSDRQKYTEEFFNSNYEIVEYSKDEQFKHITYKKLSFKITSGDVIFCNTNQVDNLFYHIKKLVLIN